MFITRDYHNTMFNISEVSEQNSSFYDNITDGRISYRSLLIKKIQKLLL